MSLTMLTASGYVTGDANTPAKTTIRRVWVFPGTSAGSWKLEGGVSGTGENLIPSNNAVVPTAINPQLDQIPYAVELKIPIKVDAQVYATLTNCKILVEHGS